MAPPRAITTFEKVDLVLGFAQSVLATLVTAFVAPFRGSNTPSTWSRHVLLSLVRRVLDRLSPEQLQSIAGSTESNYFAWCKAQKLSPRTVELAGFDTKAFWIGDSNADNIVVFYHGGGWAMPAGDGHFVWMLDLVSRATKAGKSIAVLCLEYELAPGGQYPRQLQQAVELLRYTLTELRKSPDHIMLIGDSAGGNMILGVLSHIMHPNPAIQPLQLTQPLKSAMLSSPVTILNTKNDRFRTREAQDPASAQTIRIWLKNVLGSHPPDAWTEPLNNDVKWWSGLDRVINSILITVATNEMMADDTCATAATIKSAYPGLTLFKSDIDFHAEPSIGRALGMKEGEAARTIISWAIERS